MISKNRNYSDWMKASSSLLKEIKRIDPLLDLKFSLGEERWHLVRYPFGFYRDFTIVWKLEENPEKGLHRHPGSWMIDTLKRADVHREGVKKFADEMDARDELARREHDRKLEDATMEYAKEIRKPLQNLYDNGPNSSYKGVF